MIYFQILLTSTKKKKNHKNYYCGHNIIMVTFLWVANLNKAMHCIIKLGNNNKSLG